MNTHTHTVSTHTAVNTHTHTVSTHPEQWAANAAVAGEQLGVRCLAQGSHLSRGIEGGESAGHSLPPPTIPAGPETWTHDSLSIRPRLQKTSECNVLPQWFWIKILVKEKQISERMTCSWRSAHWRSVASLSGATDHKTHGSDHITDFESRIGSFFGSAKKNSVFLELLKAYFKYFYTTAKTTSWTNKVSNKTRTITQITSVDEYSVFFTVYSNKNSWARIHEES